MSHTGPIANERLRVKTAVMRADQLLAQGVDEEYEAEMEESRYFIVPGLRAWGNPLGKLATSNTGEGHETFKRSGK